MVATPYRAINWNPTDLIGEDKMDQLANNTQWLYENTPRAVYTLPSGIRRTENVRIACGRVVITARPGPTGAVAVNFTNLFSAGCDPIITTSVLSIASRRMFAVINGLGSRVQPDNRGFSVYIEVDGVVKATDTLTENVWIHWQAMGY